MRVYYDPPPAGGGYTNALMTRYSGSVYAGWWSLALDADNFVAGGMYWYIEGQDWPGNKGWSATQSYLTVINFCIN